MRHLIAALIVCSVCVGCTTYSGPFNLTAMLAESDIFTMRQGSDVALLDGKVDAAPAAQAVVEMLQAQVAAWNAGDLEGFMEHYWKSDNLIFVADGKLINGWQSTLDRYRKRYPTGEEMGQLDFSDLRVFVCRPLPDNKAEQDIAYAAGRWTVRHGEQTHKSGTFALVLENTDSKWTIVLDETKTDKPAG